MKKGLVVLFSFIFLIAMVFFVTATNHTSNISDSENVSGDDLINSTEKEFEDAELGAREGITPDSGLYFVEEGIFSKFRSDSKNREKKVAEIRAMIREGKIDEAKIALERYREYADRLEKEADPETEEEAKRSAAAIKRALEEVEEEIPEEDKKELFDDVIEKEGDILVAVEISAKIRDLCRTLSELDPVEYSRVCKTEEDAPKWQRDLDEELTSEQEEEAKEFFEIMTQCFETSGETCRCEDIGVTAFANKCSQIAPLAYACEVEDNEAACEEMDKIEGEEPIEDLLPPHLQDVLRQAEGRFEDERFEKYAPRECVEAGVETRESCMEIMFRNEAPRECVDALDRGEIDLGNEREAREQCEEIMFELEAPQECIDEGITDHRECGKLMFELNAPQECIDAGLTGEYERDHRECEKIIRSFEGDREFDRGGPNRGPGLGVDCRGIEDPEERLRCYDSASSGLQEYHDDSRERFEETREAQRRCAESCSQNNEAWDFSNGECRCFRHEGQEDYDEFYDDKPEEDYRDSDEYRDFREEERRRCDEDGGSFTCEGDTCYCDFPEQFNEEESFDDGSFDMEEECSQEGGTWDGSTCVFDDETTTEESTSEEDTTTEDTTTTEEETTDDSTSTDDGSTEEETTSDGTTGSVISGSVVLGENGDNGFLKYFFRIFD